MTVLMAAIVLAAHPWTYWMAPPLLVAAVVLDLAIAALYFKRFVLPRLVVKLMEDDRPVQHPVQMRPRREAAEPERVARSSAA